jgi:Holliday junction resolvase-like predicted endonuclease
VQRSAEINARPVEPSAASGAMANALHGDYTAAELPDGHQWLPLPEAMRALGLSDSAIRRRVRRGAMAGCHGLRGELLVAVPEALTAQGVTVTEAKTQASELDHLRALLAVREEQVDQLRAEVDAWRRAAEDERDARHRQDVVIQGLTQRIPRLHSPEDYADHDQEPDHQPGSPPRRRRWWRLGG